MDASLGNTLRRIGTVLVAGLGAALLVLLALWLLYRSDDPLELSGARLQLTSGEGVQTPDALKITQPGSNGVVVVQAAIRPLEAEDYRALSWRLDGLTSDQELRLIWSTAKNPQAPMNRLLEFGRDGRLDLREEPNWRGRIVAIGLVVTGPFPGEISVSGLELRPKTLTPAMLAAAMRDDWMHDGGWTGRSINFNVGASRNARFPPVPLVALWAGLAMLLHAFLKPPWRGYKNPAPYAVFLLIGWLALDLRWQWNLGQRLEQTRDRYAGLDEPARQLAGPDRDVYPFLREVRRRLSAEPGRVFILGSDPNGYRAGRARYQLSPHNVHAGFSDLPGKGEAHPGDYVLLLTPLNQMRYDRQRGVLVSPTTERPVEFLSAKPGLGALFRITGED